MQIGEDRLRRVIDASPTAMVMINRDGLMLMVNIEAERVFGHSRAEMLGQSVEMLLPERFRAGHPELRHLFYPNPQSRRMGVGRELYALRKDNSEFPVEIGLNPIETEDGYLVLSEIVDITESKQREQRIEAALREKDVLLREIHHRVKNNLQIIDSMLNLHAARISDTQVQELLRESQNRIRSMALVHQTLYQSNDFARVDFNLFLQSLLRTLASSHGLETDRILLQLDTTGITLPIDTAIPCGLAVNELISNALKHAFPDDRSGCIRIRMQEVQGDRVEISVEDNGVGLPPDLDIQSAATLGLQLVNLLTDQLSGQLNIERDGCTRFTLQFPGNK